MQDGREGGARIFDVEVELAGLEGFVDQQRAAEVGFAFDGDAGAGFDVLGEELGEDDLLGEEFGADGDFGLRRFVTSGNEVKEGQEIKEVNESERSAGHVSGKFSWVRGRKNLTQRTPQDTPEEEGNDLRRKRTNAPRKRGEDCDQKKRRGEVFASLAMAGSLVHRVIQ